MIATGYAKVYEHYDKEVVSLLGKYTWIKKSNLVQIWIFQMKKTVCTIQLKKHIWSDKKSSSCSQSSKNSYKRIIHLDKISVKKVNSLLALCYKRRMRSWRKHLLSIVLMIVKSRYQKTSYSFLTSKNSEGTNEIVQKKNNQRIDCICCVRIR